LADIAAAGDDDPLVAVIEVRAVWDQTLSPRSVGFATMNPPYNALLAPLYPAAYLDFDSTRC
ncbi:hypothetical protein, partial [Pseudomonas aeruginosa]|uniref:hypothetical protein n=1 Tax=Pseudomonas aeruginosa TaxID=287 RepID=UPI003969795E